MTPPVTHDADFDPAALDAYLRQTIGELEGAPAVERISGGQSNPTYFITYRNRRLVMRKKPSGVVLPSAHAVEREYRIQSALAGAFPVPKMVLLCEDPGVIGAAFYLMERVDGRVYADCALPGLEPESRRAIYLNLADTLAAMHRIDVAAVGLSDYGRPDGYFARQLKTTLALRSESAVTICTPVEPLPITPTRLPSS